MFVRQTRRRLVLGSMVAATMLMGPTTTWVWAGSNKGTTLKNKGSNIRIDVPVTQPKLIAVRFHHDMCPYCKKLAPKFERVAKQANKESVLYVTLDMSTEASQIQAALLVGALGLGDLWPGDLSKIATVTFVDGRTKREMSTFRADGNGQFDHAVRDALAKLGDKR